ncbi:MAG: substrate-binding domain-containing protein [Planctomycetales bacterium]|nr:substrate-binding domain-containing protein [Planctomycetales bacterium]
MTLYGKDNHWNRRSALSLAGGALLGLTGCEQRPGSIAPTTRRDGATSYANEEYVWLSANASLPLFTKRDHPALRLAGDELGVQVTVAGPNSVDIPALVAAIEQTAARKPAGMLVVGWDPSALVGPINHAVAAGIPVICVDADVASSNRASFIGTDWRELGARQAEGMLAALDGRKGEVALLGLIEQSIDQDAFVGFRSVAEPAGLTVLSPQQDKGNQVEAARVASSILQGHPKLVGMAGFDSESGPGMAQAIMEGGKTGKIVATCVDDQEQHLRLCKQGVLSVLVGQKRELFTYLGIKALFEINHSPLQFSADDRAAGIWPIPVNYNTGSYVVTSQNVDLFLSRHESA